MIDGGVGGRISFWFSAARRSGECNEPQFEIYGVAAHNHGSFLCNY